MTSSLVPEVSERCGEPRTPGSKITCELAHGHIPEIDEEHNPVRTHTGRDAAGRWHSWVAGD